MIDRKSEKENKSHFKTNLLVLSIIPVIVQLSQNFELPPALAGGKKINKKGL
jgi:hypothetical protein